MSRFLHRPMFRRGGSTGEGITSGLRQGYNRGRVVNPGGYDGEPDNIQDWNIENKTRSTGSTKTDFPTFPEIKLPKSTAGADFWLNLGTSILAQPGGRPILQTLGTAGQEPLARFQQQRAAEGQLEYKKAVSDRSFMLETWKAMNEDERLDIQKKARLAFENGDFDSYEEALSEFISASVYTKSGHYRPEVQKRLDKEAEREKIDRAAEGTQKFLSAEEGVNVSLPQAIVINEFYDQAHAQDPVWEYDDIPFIDKNAIATEWIGLNKKVKDWISPEGNIAIPPDLQNDYNEGLYYVDHFNGDVYKVGPGSTELIKVKLDEIKIN